MPYVENLGSGGGTLDAQYGSAPGANTNAPLLLDPTDSGPFVYTPGTAGNYVSVPHSPSLNILGTQGTPFLSLQVGNAVQRAESPPTASLAITGDIEVVVRASSLNWRIPSTTQVAFANRDSAATVGGWQFFVFGGNAYFNWVDAGTLTSRQFAVTAAQMPAGSGTYWVRWRLDFDGAFANGAQGQAWYHPDQTAEPAPSSPGWVSLGTGNPPSATTGIAPSVSILQIGQVAAAPAQGDNCGVYRTIVRNGIAGTTVFDADFTQQALGSRGFIESTGKLVTLVGNAAQIVDGTTYGFMPGATGSYFSTPDSAALSITGDLDIRVRVSLNDYTPAAEQVLVSKWNSTGNQRSYALRWPTSGTPYISWSTDGVAVNAISATVAAPFTDGQAYWLRATLDVDNGAAGRTATFEYAPDSATEPTSWTAIGTAVTQGGVTSIFDGTASLEVGSFVGGTSPMAGRMYRVIVRPNLTTGAKAFDADFTRQLQFNPSLALAGQTFTEGSPNLATVTANGVARVERDRDLDLRVQVALDDWTPTGNQILLSRWAPNEYSYILFVSAVSGQVQFGYSPTGAAAQAAFVGSGLSAFGDRLARWIRLTADVNNGANGHTFSFFTSQDGTTWTPLGSPVTSTGAVSIFPGRRPLEVGIEQAASSPTAGKWHNAQILNGIDGPAVLDLDFGDTITTGSEVYLPDTPSEVIPEAEQFLPNLGWGGAALNARFGSAVTADTNDPLLLTHTGTNYLYLPGATLNYASVPSAIGSPTDITGDLAIAFHVANRGTADGAVVLKRESGVDGSLSSYNFGQFNISGVLVYRFIWVQSDGTARDVITTIPIRTEFAHHAVTHDVDDGTGGNVLTFYASNDGANWSLAGSVRNAYVTDHRSNAAHVAIGGSNVGVVTVSGEYRRVRIWNTASLSGIPVLDANFTTGITSGAQTAFTESSTNAATVTINRSTSGRKSVAVVQDVLLFGTDDYLEVPDSDLLDFGASESFTVMTALRQWATTADARFVVKADSGTGWLLSQFTSTQAYFQATTPGQFPTAFSAVNLGALLTVVGVRDVATDTVGVSVDGAALTIVTDTTSGTLANAGVLRVGLQSGGTAIAAEFRGSAIWRRALTAAEVALVNTHYTTGPTAASTALMQQAVWWIDAGTRSVAQINRSTSGRKTVACSDCVWLLGTDDYFEIADGAGLLDFGQGDDFSLLVIARSWWAQGTSDTFIAKTGSTVVSAQGWDVANGTGDPWAPAGSLGDGTFGASASSPARAIGTRQAVLLVRDTTLDTLTAWTNTTPGTPVADATTGTSANSSPVRIGRLSDLGAEYLDAEIKAAAVWRRKLSPAEIAAVLNYYGVA